MAQTEDWPAATLDGPMSAAGRINPPAPSLRSIINAADDRHIPIKIAKNESTSSAAAASNPTIIAH